jgi:hypothetical protein
LLTLPYPYPYPHNPSSLLVPLVPQSPSAPTAARLRELKSSLVARGASKPPSPAARTDTPMGSTLERSTPERQQRCAVPGVVQRGVSRLLQVARRLSKPVGRMLPALPTCSGRTALLALAATLGCAAVAAAAVQGPSHVLASMAALSGQVCFVYERLVYIVGRADLGFPRFSGDASPPPVKMHTERDACTERQRERVVYEHAHTCSADHSSHPLVPHLAALGEVWREERTEAASLLANPRPSRWSIWLGRGAPSPARRDE